MVEVTSIHLSLSAGNPYSTSTQEGREIMRLKLNKSL
jgi:hypothetical protein